MHTLQTQPIVGRYLSVTTFRADGSGVATPVWFVEQDGRYFVETDSTSYKVKRIAANPAVTVARCNARGRLRGEPVPGRAVVLATDQVLRLRPLFAQKYRVDLVLIMPFRKLQAVFQLGKVHGPSVIVEITPTPHEEPATAVRTQDSDGRPVDGDEPA